MATNNSVKRLTSALNIFRQIDPTMPIQYAVCFLEIAQHEDEGIAIGELANLMSMVQSSATRQVYALSQFKEEGKPGHDLVEATVDPFNRRRKIVKLKPKGKLIINQINALMED